MSAAHPTQSRDFIREIIDADLAAGRHDRVATRFPPEPNGYLHIGHAKSICLNFGIALQYGGTCNLRFDDTNPAKEEVEYVESIQRDVKWLGFDIGKGALFASDYFERMYQLAELLIEKGVAYVDDSTEEEIRQGRGTLKSAGVPSAYRERSAEENLALFRGMRAGEFPDGKRVLRAKIDLAAANMKLRDPLLYRIRHAHHHRTGDNWCIYPMYDYAHPLEDAFEGITHSICTLEFIDNREIYDWVIRETEVESVPHQYEFARLNLDYTIMSKRKLAQLVEQGLVSGWDDPRMPTIAGMRRRGITPEAIRKFCDMIGVAKNNSTVDIGKLEYSIRDDLNYRAPRVLAVLQPLEVVLTNYEAESSESIDAPYFPPDVGKPGSRLVSFSRTLYIERDDFAAEPDVGFRRLAPGRIVRLRHAHCIRCDEVVRDDNGEISQLRCTYFDDTEGTPKGEKVWGVVHWVSEKDSLPAEVRIYDRLFKVAKPDAGGNFLDYLNSDSLRTLTGARIEASVANDDPDTRYQFERLGYFTRDPVDSTADALVFNRIVTLRDSWSKRSGAGTAAGTATATATGAAKATATGSARSKTRPPRRTAAEYRTEARARSELLAKRFTRYQSAYGLSQADADVLTGDLALGDLLEAAVEAHPEPAAIAKWLLNELGRALDGREVAEAAFSGKQLGQLVALVDRGAISSTAGKEVFAAMVVKGEDPQVIVDARGLAQVSDSSAIEPIVVDVLTANEGKVAEYRSGRKGLLGFFVGQVMKSSGGVADPKLVREIVERKLG